MLDLFNEEVDILQLFTIRMSHGYLWRGSLCAGMCGDLSAAKASPTGFRPNSFIHIGKIDRLVRL